MIVKYAFGIFIKAGTCDYVINLNEKQLAVACHNEANKIKLNFVVSFLLDVCLFWKDISV